MPCALTEPGNYPDYLKKILSIIDVGNDNDLKACACSLRSPVNSEGCLILDSDNKIGAIPTCFAGECGFCHGLVTTNLSDLMEIYWKVKSWKITASGGFVTSDETPASVSYSGSFGLIRENPIISQKNLVCIAASFGGFYFRGEKTIACRYHNQYVSGGSNLNTGFVINIGRNNEICINNNQTFSFCLFVYSYNPGEQFNFSSSPDQVGPWGQAGSAEIKLQNRVVCSVPIYCEGAAGGGSVRLVIEPETYWS